MVGVTFHCSAALHKAPYTEAENLQSPSVMIHSDFNLWICNFPVGSVGVRNKRGLRKHLLRIPHCTGEDMDSQREKVPSLEVVS